MHNQAHNLHFDTRISGVSRNMLTDDECRKIAQLALLVFDLTPRAIRRIVTFELGVTPEHIQNDYQNFRYDINQDLCLNKFERKMFSEPGDGLINCDTSVLYKIFRFYNDYHSPTYGWNTAVYDFKNYKDLVVLLKQMRNYIAHHPNIRFSEYEMRLMKYHICAAIGTVAIMLDDDELSNLIQSYMS